MTTAAKKGNMFSMFADEDEDVPQQKTAPVQKKVEQKPKPQTAAPQQIKKQKQVDDGNGEFQAVTAGEKQDRSGRGGRGGQRGGRGGRGGPRPEGEEGGFRGGRGGRGERRPRVEGEEGTRGGRGERRPRAEGEEGTEGGYRGGRGGRGERRPRTEGEEGATRGRGRGRGEFRRREEGENTEGGDEGVIISERKEKVDFKGREEHFAGKKREQWHPYDRKDGTGRGRGLPKDGHGKGNWGNTKDEVKAAETAEGESPKKPEEGEAKEGEAVEETPKDEKFQDAAEPEPEEEEEKSMTLQEYMASKKKSTIKKEARKAEEVKKANIEVAAAKSEKVSGLSTNLKNQELYSAGTAKSELSNLLSFQGQEDFFPSEERRGGRGGFRGGRGGRGGPRPTGDRPQGGRGQKQSLRVDEEAFPSLS